MDILSIDFDFFQKFPEDKSLRDKILAVYPDPIDYDTRISEVVWGSKYSIGRVAELIKKVSINFDALDLLQRKLLLVQSRTPVLVTNSHRHIYEFIGKIAKPGSRIRVSNLDFHHDAYFKSDVVGCGNWAWHLQNNYKLDYIWVRPDTEPYAPHVLDKEPTIYESVQDFFNKEDKFRPKAVFICRSDPYLPPHLDTYFEDFIGYLQCLFTTVIGERGITKKREILHFEFPNADALRN